MKNVVKKMMTVLLITNCIVTQAFEQVADHVCSSEDLTIEVFLDGAPRGGGMVILDLGDGKKHTLYTSFTFSEGYPTRCGTTSYYNSSLYKAVNDFSLEGKLSIFHSGEYCGSPYSSAYIDIEVNGEVMTDKLSCQ